MLPFYRKFLLGSPVGDPFFLSSFCIVLLIGSISIPGCTETPSVPEGGARNVDALFAEIDTLSGKADERGEAILGALYDYAESIAPDMN